VIYDEIIAPLIEAQDKVDKLRAGVEDSQTKDREIPVGKEKAIPILESDLVQAKKSLAEERKTHATVVADANARGVAMPEKGDREIQLEGYISQLENRIVVETQARQIEKYDVAGSENAYQTEDLGPNLAVSEYQEDWSPGSLAVAPTRIRPMPREDFEESSYLSEDMGIGEQSIPSGYRDPARLHTGRTKQIDEDTLFDLPVSRAPEDTGNYLQSLSEVAPAIETSTTVSQQVLATLTTMQKRLLNETTKGSYSGGTINQKIDIGGANIVINQASGSVNDLKKMLKLELAEHDRQVRADMSRAAKSISATEE
jgi:hypothetical protein